MGRHKHARVKANSPISSNLDVHMRAGGINRTKLAKAAGMNQMAIAAAEASGNKIKLETIIKIVDALNSLLSTDKQLTPEQVFPGFDAAMDTL